MKRGEIDLYTCHRYKVCNYVLTCKTVVLYTYLLDKVNYLMCYLYLELSIN